MIRIALIEFPGSNCERETALAVTRAGMQPIHFPWNGSKAALADYDGYILVGGFSYEDRSRAGIIAAMDPLMQSLRIQAAAGKPILGICNGAQILVESGLVPGLSDHAIALALTDNQREHKGHVIGAGFYNAWVHIRLSDPAPWTAFSQTLTSKDILRMPVAHAEGRFVIPPVLLAELQEQGMRVFQYCDAKGALTASFPVNPNGSVDNIAALSNRAGNVLAIMPHPERTPAGDPLFRSLKDYIASGHTQQVRPLRYAVQPPLPGPYALPEGASEYLVGLSVTDNNAASVEMVFRHQGKSVRLRRHVHWQVAAESKTVLEAMEATGFLLNPRKEYRLFPAKLPRGPQISYLLVQAKEDVLGKQRLQQFREHFHIEGLRDIRHGVLWQIETETPEQEDVVTSPVFYNPFSHNAWVY